MQWSSCTASSSTSCPRASCESDTTACSPTASATSCCRSHTSCSPSKAANNFPCHPCPKANSGTVPAAAKPCESSSASPPLNSIWQPSIPHDRLRQSGPPTCSLHVFTPVCSKHQESLQNQIYRQPRTAQSKSYHETAH